MYVTGRTFREAEEEGQVLQTTIGQWMRDAYHITANSGWEQSIGSIPCKFPMAVRCAGSSSAL